LNQNDVLAKLQEVFDDVFIEPVKVTPELTANDVPEWDSLLQIPLVISIERAFNLRFHVGEVAATKNVGELADLILRRLGNG
jgi:acyl carrier protein